MADEAPSFKQSEPHPLPELKNRHPRDIAEEISDFPLARVREILRGLPDAMAAEVISELPRDMQLRLFESMQVSNLSGIVSEMFSDDVADVLGHVSSARLREIMSSMPVQEASQISDLLKYPEDTAGGIMQTEVIAVSEELSISEALAVLRKQEEDLPNGIFYIYVTDAEARLRGVLRVRDLLFRPSDLKIGEIMVPEVRAVSVHADQEEIARLFRGYGFSAIPVVDDFQRLRGVVTADDVLDVLEEEATEDMQRMVGLSGEESADTPWTKSVRNRLPWLYFNLATAFLAGWVVSSVREHDCELCRPSNLPANHRRTRRKCRHSNADDHRSLDSPRRSARKAPSLHPDEGSYSRAAQWLGYRFRSWGSFMAMEEQFRARRDHVCRDGDEHDHRWYSRRRHPVGSQGASHRSRSCLGNHAYNSYGRGRIFPVSGSGSPCFQPLSRGVLNRYPTPEDLAQFAEISARGKFSHESSCVGLFDRDREPGKSGRTTHSCPKPTRQVHLHDGPVSCQQFGRPESGGHEPGDQSAQSATISAQCRRGSSIGPTSSVRATKDHHQSLEIGRTRKLCTSPPVTARELLHAKSQFASPWSAEA